ncbi:plasmid replication protein, CyRepA1 family [Synechocystis sp. LKSZ1]|uniref:plasmid replication protein, CyRepA1 family n=1 Tax=Synechocystis sp. LKSZ1 TaxID=3144951 RepID=UPI00336C1C52
MDYLQEWQASCVDDQLIHLNVTSLQGNEASEHLLYADTLPRRNDGRVSQSILNRYEHTVAGGWWCSGIDLLSGERDLWGCFKPNSPRIHQEKGKVIKYEHPPQAPTGLFALRVPLHLWQRIAERAGLSILAEDLDPEQEDGGFWQWLMQNPQIPLCITEGAKKAGSLLTAGLAAIALPGVHSGYRTPKDALGRRIGKSHLIPALQKLAVPQRPIYIVFDQDPKPKTIQQVHLAVRRLGYLFQQNQCLVKVMTWNPVWGKGIDDLIAQQGLTILEQVYDQALSLEVWQAKSFNRLTYGPSLALTARYLPDLPLPASANLIAVKSPKGTGKSQWLSRVVGQAMAEHRPVLLIGHRIRLVQELCQRFNLDYVTDVKDGPQGTIYGYGLCIDSLHPQSQAQFNPKRWADSLIIIDEVEQVLWHALNGDTCRSHRVAILKSLKQLLQTALSGDGRLIVADADLSDVSLDYLTALAGIPLDPYLICNDWQPDSTEAWPVYHYGENDPRRLVKHLVQHIRDGGRPFVCLSAQKLTSAWGTRNLEAYLQRQFPQVKILRLDAESLSDPSHPAYNAVSQLNDLLPQYDVVLASPAIETGVSIDLKGHFTAVWAIAQGVQTATSVCQALGRIRENIPRYLWVASYGFNQVGNGSTSIPALLTSGQRLTDLNIRLLQQADLADLDDLDTGFQAESLLCWARMAVRVNAAMIHYRDSVLALLQQEGHQLLGYPPPPQSQGAKEDNDSSNQEPLPGSQQLAEAIQAVREQNYQAECEAIATAPLLSVEDFEALKKRLIKSPNERHALRRYELQQRYGVPVTPELVQKDDQGWYQRIRLHYFLTLGRPYLADRDTKIARTLIDQGHGSLFLPDFNGSQLGAKIGTLDVLGLPILLANPQRELCALDADLQRLAEIALRNRQDIKTVMGIGLAKNAGPITILRRFLDCIGYGLAPLKRKRFNQKSVRVYRLVPPQDGRETVLQQWLERDRQLPGSSEGWLEDFWLRLQSPVPTMTTLPYVQLSLALTDHSPDDSAPLPNQEKMG